MQSADTGVSFLIFRLLTHLSLLHSRKQLLIPQSPIIWILPACVTLVVFREFLCLPDFLEFGGWSSVCAFRFNCFC